MDLIADLCQKVVVLSEGQVLTEGTMSNVKNDERVIQAYFGGGVNI
jgi:branched-chain amino acid transport system ATP-binding protein